MSGNLHDCQSPLQFYTCKSNGFIGCCSVDPCDSSGCPDSAVSSSNPASKSSPKPASASSPALHTLAASSIKPVFAGPGPTSSSFTSSNPFEAATLLVPKPAAPTTSTGDASTVLITSVVFVSQEIITPTSNGIVLAPTSSLITSTALSSLSTPKAPVSSHLSTSSSAVVSSLPSASPAQYTHSRPTNAIVAGSVGGVAGILFAVLLICLLIRWQRLRREKELRRAQHDDDPRLQGIDAHRAGSAFKEEDGYSPYGIEADAAGANQYTGSRSAPISPLSPTSHRTRNTTVTHPGPLHDKPNPGMEGLMSGSNNHHPELSGEPAASVLELSPRPDRSAINTPKRASVPAFDHMESNAVKTTQATEGFAMHPNLDPTMPSPTSEGREAGNRKHVMSWMDYDAASPGPAR